MIMTTATAPAVKSWRRVATGRDSVDLTEPFLLRALGVGVAMAVVCGPLGCLLVWRRMAYFGDALSHSALLGVALGAAAGISASLPVIVVCLVAALMLSALNHQHWLAPDTLLGIMAQGALAIGMVTLSFVQGARIDLMAALFGDVLSVGPLDLVFLVGAAAIALALLIALWSRFLSVAVDEGLARVEGLPVRVVRAAQMLLIAIVIAVAMRIVGVLLVTALLLMPAATVRGFVRSPEAMAIAAAAVGALAVAGGLALSLAFDTPAGPSIVVAALVYFLFGISVSAQRAAR